MKTNQLFTPKGLKLFILILLLIFIYKNSYSQNCSVNANVDFSICANDTIQLNGAKGGLFINDSSTFWVQIAGPSVIIENRYNLATKIYGHQPGNTYTFRLLTTCEDNVLIYDDINITVKNASQANAGTDTTLCPGVFNLSANNLMAGEMGYWDIESINNGITIETINNPHSSIQISDIKSGSTILKWTVINPNGCNTSDEVVITNRGGVSNVSAGGNRILTNCYNTSTNVILSGSYGGTGVDGQIGTWSTVSGPSTPNILSPSASNSTVTGLVEGVYLLKWSVVGTCVNNSSTMEIAVSPSSGPITTAGGGINPSTLVICDTSQRTVLLNGPNPQYANEVTEWYQATSLPCNIESPTSPTTSVTNMNGNGAYQFIYKITNTITGCSTSSLVRITYATPSNITVTSPLNMTLPLDSTFGIITYEYSGGNTTKYAIISTPDSIITTPQYINSASPQIINGLMAPGQYLVRFKRLTDGGEGSCFESYADVIINVSFSPHSSNAGTNQILGCTISTTTLVGNEINFEFGNWNQISGPSIATIVNPTNNITLVNNLINGNYRFRWSVNGGINSPTYYSDVDINVSLITPTQANAGSDLLNICYNTSIDLNGNQPLNNEIGTWTSIPENSLLFSDANNPHAQVSGITESSSYKIIWSIGNECGITHDTILLTTNATMGPISANAGVDRCLTYGTEIAYLIGNTAQNCIGNWTQLSGPTCNILTPTLSTTEITGLQSGTYLFVWTLSLNNCSSRSDTITITIPSESQISNHTQSVNQCSNEILITGTASSTGIGNWYELNGPTNVIFPNINSNQNQLTNLASGSYTFLWKVTTGVCTIITDTLKYEIYTPPTIANAGLDIVLCAPDSIAHLNANTPLNGIGYWSFISGPSTPIISNYNAPNANVKGLTMGTYILRWNIQGNSNCPISYDNISINYSPLANAGAPIKLCNRSNVTLIGTANSTGVWTFVNGPNTPSINTIGANSVIVNNLITGTYTFKYTISGNCTSSSNVTVTNYEMPSLSNAGTDQLLCNSNSVQLNAQIQSVGTATWTHSGPGGGSFVPNATSASAQYTPLVLGTHTFTWKITNGVCTTSDITIIKNYGALTASEAGRDTTICGLTLKLNGNSPMVGVGIWSKISGPGNVMFSNTSLYNSVATCSTPGLYKLRWTISSENPTCGVNTNYSEVEINFLSTPPIAPNAGIDKTICSANELTLSANDVFPSLGHWIYVNGPTVPTFNDIQNNNATVSNLNPGNYTLLWSADFNGCYAQDSIRLTIYETPSNSITGSDIEICQYNSILLTANQPQVGNGFWTQQQGPNNAIINNPNSNTTDIWGVIPGEYKFSWTITNGDCMAEISTIKVTVIENPTQSIAGVSHQLCNENSIILTGNIPTIGTGEWNFVSGPNVPSIHPINNQAANISGLIDGDYTFSWSISNGICSSASTVNVTNSSPPIITAQTIPSCNNGSITLVSNLTAHQTFYLYSELGVLISSWTGFSNSNTFSNIPTGTYFGKISHHLCTSDLSNSIHLINLSNPTTPLSTIVDRNNICPTDNGTITFTCTGGIGDSIAWYINNNSTPIYYGSTFITASPNITTTYYSANINSCGTSIKDSIILVVNDIEPPNATTNTSTIITSAGECEVNNITLSDPLATDNCGIGSMSNNCSNSLSVGSHQITWTITDINGNESQVNQQVIVLGAPKSIADNFSVENGHSSELFVLQNDIDCDNNINRGTLSVSVQPIHGSATINSTNGTIIFTPNSEYVGNDTLVYQICDSTNLCNSNYVILEVNQSNIAPQIPDSSFTTTENTETHFCLPITDIYGPFPFNIATQNCAHGIVTSEISASAVCITYTPQENYVGIDTLFLQICDNGWLCDTSIIKINILPKPDLPVIALTQKATLLDVDKNGNFLYNILISVHNIGETNLIGITIMDTLANTFNSAISYSVISQPQTSGQLIANTNFDGNSDANLLSGNSLLSKNGTDSITFNLLIKPNGQFGIFSNSCYGFAIGLNQIHTIDISNDGCNYDQNNNGNPNEENENNPTPIMLYSIPKFGLVQSLISTNQISKNRYLIDLSFKLKNIGNDAIHNLDLQNKLSDCFNSSSFTVQKTYSSNGSITINPLFDGKQNDKLFENSASEISINDSSEIRVSIFVTVDFGIHTFFNSAILEGYSSENISINDISDNGDIIDKNANGITNEIGENEPTKITIGENEVWVPEGFSPNGDGENDYFVIKGNEYFTLKLQVFNRWGNLIYVSSDYQDDWNGNPNTGISIDNQDVSDGTYFYIIDLNNNTNPIQGSFTINR